MGVSSSVSTFPTTCLEKNKNLKSPNFPQNTKINNKIRPSSTLLFRKSFLSYFSDKIPTKSTTSTTIFYKQCDEINQLKLCFMCQPSHTCVLRSSIALCRSSS